MAVYAALFYIIIRIRQYIHKPRFFKYDNGTNFGRENVRLFFAGLPRYGEALDLYIYK